VRQPGPLVPIDTTAFVRPALTMRREPVRLAPGENKGALSHASEWRSRAEDRSFLLSGSDLREAERWLAQHDGKKDPAPTALQSQYFLASRRAAARRQRILLAAVVIGLAVTSVLAVLALLQRNEAVAQAKTARSRALAASAVAQLPADPELSADPTNVTALRANTALGLPTASTTPPRAGPRRAPRLSIVLDETLAATSSPGLRASTGSRAQWAGRNGVAARAATEAVAYTAGGGPSKAISAAPAARATARAACTHMRRRCRGKRSARSEANGTAKADGSTRRSPTTPTASTPPLS
jgi:hypothetical protein